MSVTGTLDSLRLNRFETERLALALTVSIAIHLILFGGYVFGRELNLFPWLHHPAKKPHPVQAAPVTQQTEPPLVFVDVNPEQAATEAPKDAKYYSDRNSRAANPDVTVDSNQPKLNGKQTDMPKTEDAPRPQLSKLQPAPETPREEQREQQSQLAMNPGDLTLGRPQDSPSPAPERPRTIRQALAQQPNRPPGRQMQQDGGTHRVALVPSFDAKATPFGAYDRAFIDAVQQHWYDLLDSRQFALDRSGKVTLQFRLSYDGRITEMTTLENTVGEVLGYVCQKAIEDPAPYEKWPTDMRQMVGDDYREITFTFYYY